MKNNKLNFDKLNDEAGIYLGKNINAAPVVMEHKKFNKNVHTLNIGKMGSGMSFNLNSKMVDGVKKIGDED